VRVEQRFRQGSLRAENNKCGAAERICGAIQGEPPG
jgi:hypothetical protein